MGMESHQGRQRAGSSAIETGGSAGNTSIQLSRASRCVLSRLARAGAARRGVILVAGARAGGATIRYGIAAAALWSALWLAVGRVVRAPRRAFGLVFGRYVGAIGFFGRYVANLAILFHDPVLFQSPPDFFE